MSLNKNRNIEDKLISALFHRNETVFERHAREQKSKEYLGEGFERLATVYIPGVLFYKFVKEVKQRKLLNDTSSLSRKVVVYSAGLGLELSFDLAKVGMGYALYELMKNFPQ